MPSNETFWGDWRWYGWEVEKTLTVPTSRTPQGYGSHLAKTLNHKLDSGPWLRSLFLLPRSPRCEVTSPPSPTAHPQIPYSQVIWCFQHETRGYFVWDLVDFFRHIETCNVNHSLSSLLSWRCRLMGSDLRPYLPPLENHHVLCTSCCPVRPNSVKSGTIWSSILACSAVDGIRRVKDWHGESWLRAPKKNNHARCSCPLFSCHTLLGGQSEWSFHSIYNTALLATW